MQLCTCPIPYWYLCWKPENYLFARILLQIKLLSMSFHLKIHFSPRHSALILPTAVYSNLDPAITWHHCRGLMHSFRGQYNTFCWEAVVLRVIYLLTAFICNVSLHEASLPEWRGGRTLLDTELHGTISTDRMTLHKYMDRNYVICCLLFRFFSWIIAIIPTSVRSIV